MNFTIFVLSMFRTRLFAENHLVMKSMARFILLCNSASLSADKRTLVSSAYMMGLARE